jgi:LacI family gluconate utilization system Gnt-I transcriptional repressor
MQSGARALGTLMESPDPPTAIFFAVDMMAAGGIFECSRRGIAVPDQLAIAGFGNHSISSEIVPKLTTAGVSGYEMGARTAQLLTARFDGQTIADPIVDVGYELIVREST